jgi:hypothetical protein
VNRTVTVHASWQCVRVGQKLCGDKKGTSDE